MLPESADQTDCCPDCGYRFRKNDKMFILDKEITHVICYNCGSEFVE